jgi:hypothetical protein
MNKGYIIKEGNKSITLVNPVKREENDVSMFLDFDKRNDIFYNNLYLEDHKIVVKIPIKSEENAEKQLKIEEFDLAKYTYLLGY